MEDTNWKDSWKDLADKVKRRKAEEGQGGDAKEEKGDPGMDVDLVSYALGCMGVDDDEITKMKLEARCIPPISEFDADLGACWGIPRNVNVRKSKNKKWFAIIDLIDSNNVLTKVRIWNVDYEKIRQQIVLNEVYAIKPNYSDGWGFSTRGHVDSAWCRMTTHMED